MPDTRSCADRAEYLKKAVAKRRKVIRKRAIEYGGGQCSICSYKNCIAALDFHHKDASTKSFGISASSLTRSWEKVRAEIDKCILVCANCHREVHAGVTQLPSEMAVE